MKVKVGEIIYVPELQPIMLILEKQDKVNICSMPEDAKKYCVCSDTMTTEEIKKFMET